VRHSFFQEHAACWDERYARSPAIIAALERLADCFGIEPGTTVVDVATGTGVLLPLLWQRMRGRGRLIACDYSFEMLARARQRPGVEAACVLGDAQMLPLAAGCCDRVVCFSALPHFPDKSRALAEFFRVLRPGEELVIAHLQDSASLNRMHRQAHPAVCGDRMPDAAALRTLLSTAGFETLLIKERPDCYLARGRRPQ